MWKYLSGEDRDMFIETTVLTLIIWPATGYVAINELHAPLWGIILYTVTQSVITTFWLMLLFYLFVVERIMTEDEDDTTHESDPMHV